MPPARPLPLRLAVAAWLLAAPVLAQPETPSAEAPSAALSPEAAAFFERLDRLYTWGDVVDEARCRIHGRWLHYRTPRPDSGQFWGTLRYADGRLDFTVDRTLGTVRPRDRWRRTVQTLIEQSGLLPTGFPVPDGPVERVDERTWRIRPADGDLMTYRMVGGRLGRVSVGRRLRFDVSTQWIPGDRYLLTRFAGRRVPGRARAPRIDYTYRTIVHNYFPRAISEDRDGESLTLLFYQWEVHLDAGTPDAKRAKTR